MRRNSMFEDSGLICIVSKEIEAVLILISFGRTTLSAYGTFHPEEIQKRSGLWSTRVGSDVGG